MNYRSFKKLLGETSLERKCRLMFGFALLCLITTSFWIYASRTRRLVESQQVDKASALVPEIIYREHIKRFARRFDSTASALEAEQAAELDPSINGLPGDLSTESANQPEETRPAWLPEAGERPLEDLETSGSETSGSETAKSDSAKVAATDMSAVLRNLDWKGFQDRISRVDELQLDARWGLLLADETPGTATDYKAFLKLQNNEPSTYSFSEDEDGVRYLNYYQAVRATRECMTCHNATGVSSYVPDSLVGMATVRLSMAGVEAQLSQNRLVLLASGIVTTVVAMIVAWVIVRYIIVKPLQHLKEVSIEIARGNMSQRSDISTGDEFEELSQAFNRMLRHITDKNEELRDEAQKRTLQADMLAQANLTLDASNQMKDEFLATMSHELRTPLNSILGFSDMLAKAVNLDDRQKRYVENIRKSGRNLMVQINDLLDLAKIESGQMDLQLAEFDIRDLIDAQVHQIMPLADQKNIELRYVDAELALPSINQDRGKLRQILTNLLSNAIKFTPEGGRVRVTSEVANGDLMALRVEDTGIGIPLSEQEQIFEKFRQGSTSSEGRDHVKREYGGTGLGLSIVRELSRLLGGDVSLESEFGKGSVFIVTIPIQGPTALLEEEQAAIESGSSTGLSSITSTDLTAVTAESMDHGDDQSVGAGDQSNRPKVTVKTIKPLKN
ncbi:MAG: HAMP domain-containing sensor histidine kinase [Fuerstiella sp.]